MKIKNPTAYLAILENNPNGADLLELDEMIAETQSIIDHPHIHPSLKVIHAKQLSKLHVCKSDLTAGRENPFWEDQKTKAQKSIDLENEVIP